MLDTSASDVLLWISDDSLKYQEINIKKQTNGGNIEKLTKFIYNDS